MNNGMNLGGILSSVLGGGQQGQGYNQNQGYSQNQGYDPNQQGYNQQGYNQGYNPNQQGYNQNQGYNGQQQNYQATQTSGFKLSIDRELYCKCEGAGNFFAKKGSWVGTEGVNSSFKFSKRLLGTNGGNIVGQVVNHFARKVTGENLELMEVTGQGVCYLADNAQHVTVIDLEPNGAFNSLVVESEDLLAFTPSCHYGVTPVGIGVLSQKGLFMSKLSYSGAGAQVAVKTNGNPKVLTAPCRVDPDCVVAWTGPNPNVKVDLNWKTLIGQTSGESYMFEFNEPGQQVIIQPYERESGLKIGIDDKRYTPTTQNNGMGSSMGEIGRVVGGIGKILG